MNKQSEYVSTAEAARIVGCSASGMYGKCRDGKIPGVVKYDSRYRIHRETLIKWMKSKAVPVKGNVENPAPVSSDPLRFSNIEKFGPKSKPKAKAK